MFRRGVIHLSTLTYSDERDTVIIKFTAVYRDDILDDNVNAMESDLLILRLLRIPFIRESTARDIIGGRISGQVCL